MGHPDIKGREAILKVHARNKPLGDDVSLAELAKGTGGFTGADLENLLNEAAIMATRSKRRFIMQADIDEAILKVVMGPEKKSRVVSERARRLTAYHESGHAIASFFLKNSDPVHYITGQKTRVAFQDGNVDSAIFCAGMGMGLVHDVVPVKVLLDRMVKEAEETINSIKASF